MASLIDRLVHSWNVFRDKETDDWQDTQYYGPSYAVRSDRPRMRYSNDKNIIASIINRIAVDVAAVDMRHVRLDENEQYLETIKSGLNNCLTVEANIDQAASHFRQDMASALCDEGHIAVVPVETSLNPKETGGYDINNLRVGRVVTWYPQHVRVSVYDERTGTRKEITVPKTMVAIVENPLYAVMNEPNSTLQRLIRKLNLLDTVDEQTSSGKLDLIIQLPYVIKSEARRQQADQRRKDIEVQLKGSQYGIAYTDGTEKITQLNRPAENNMLKQIEYLTTQLYGQLGITEEVFLGTADEATMLNYYNRTIEPILRAIAEAVKRTFLTKTARTQGQSIEYFRDSFKYVAIGDMAELADKFTRNEILTSNEFRGIMGFKPSSDPNADKLKNKNLPDADASTAQAPPTS